MCYMVRKFSLAKWQQATIHNKNLRKKTISNLVKKVFNALKLMSYMGDSIGADAITGCLRTAKNSLSYWKISNNHKNTIENAVLCLLTDPKRVKIETFDIICLRDSDIQKCGFIIENTPDDGVTIINSLKNMHHSIKNLTYKGLGDIAFLMKKYLTKYPIIISKTGVQEKEVFIIKYSKYELKEILKRAIDRELLSFEDLSEPLKKELGLLKNRCDVCDGTGKVECDLCKGTGQTKTISSDIQS